MGKILITGGAGFIGSNLALKFANDNYEVIVFDNLSPQIHGQNPNLESATFNSILSHPKITFYKGDVRNLQSWTEVLCEAEIIYHLAAETGTGQSMYELNKYTEVNVLGTSLLFQALGNLKHHKVKKIIYASSRSIYGEGKYVRSNGDYVYPEHRDKLDLEKGIFEIHDQNEVLISCPTDELSLIHPSSFYGLTKQFQENIIHTMSKHFDIIPISLRLQNVYGEGQSLKNPYTGILSIFSNLFIKNLPVTIFEDGLESRDFIHVDDVVSAFFHMSMNGIEENIFNIGTGIPTTVIEVARLLKESIQSHSEILINGAFRIGDIRHNFADISKIKREIGFNPEIQFSDGIKRFCNWAIKQNLGEINFQASLEEMKAKGLYYEK